MGERIYTEIRIHHMQGAALYNRIESRSQARQKVRGKNIMAKKKKTSIMLTDQDKLLLELLAKKENRSQTKELEYLIRRRAEELKIEEP